MSARLFRVLSAAACLTTLTFVSACGSTVGGWDTAAEMDVRTLDVGNYPVTPLDTHVDFRPGFADAYEVAGMRLADHVVTADEVDPRLIKGSMSKTGTFDVSLSGHDSLGSFVNIGAVAERNKMVFGFTTAASDKSDDWGFDWPTPATPGSTILALTVMQFNDADSATRAAAEFYGVDINDNKGNQPVALAKYPSAHAHWRPGTPTIRSFLAHGSYVVSVLALTPEPNQSALTSLTEKTLDAELPQLDQLPPVIDEDTVKLPWDPDYLLSRALNTKRSGRPNDSDGNLVVGGHGIRHFMPNRKSAADGLAALKVSAAASTSDALVLRTADTNTAHKAVTDRILLKPNSPATDAVPKVADSACVKNDGSNGNRYSCLVAYHNYVGYVFSDQLLDAHQRAAAQYALFANSQWQP
ncbi:MAG: hypothetical protein J2P18_10795 [Nocardia sp.]|nr:hypothetical protein [Nocardia sp.]